MGRLVAKGLILQGSGGIPSFKEVVWDQDSSSLPLGL